MWKYKTEVLRAHSRCTAYHKYKILDETEVCAFDISNH